MTLLGIRVSLSVFLFASSLFLANSAAAQDAITAVQESRHSPQSIRDHWASEMFFSALPVGPTANLGNDSQQPSTAEPAIASTLMTVGSPSLGGASAESLSRQLFPKEWLLARPQFSSPVLQKDQGAAKLPFTSSRLTPLASDREYPFRAVGRLFFSTRQGPSACSATVIAPRIILTAGHCVHSGSGGADGFYSDFVFVPAYRQGNAPFGDWVATAWITTTSWTASRGKVPNIADYALLELADEGGKRVGDVVGSLSVALKAVAPNHVHIIGYPAALDGGEIIHVVASSSSKKAPAKTFVYGSDMAQGSSGGPWVMNLGESADGQPSGARNVIVGVTSYVAAGFVEGSSILDTPLAQMFNAICAHQGGNCS